MNTNRNYNGKSISYYEYYKEVLNIEIKHEEQPLILVVNPKKFLGNPNDLEVYQKKEVLNSEKSHPLKFYIPELCTLIGINEEDANNYKFMEKIIEKTRLEPDKKIKQIKKCFELFYDTTEKKTCPNIVEENKTKLENLNSIIK